MSNNSDHNGKKSLAIYCPTFSGGGAEAVCLWILEALAGQYNLTLFTILPIDLDKINTMYGTQLSPEKVTVRSHYPAWTKSVINWLVANNNDRKSWARHLVLRDVKQCAEDFDLCFSAYNAVDFGRPGLQYLHYIRVVDDRSRFYALSDFSEAGIKDNVSIVNSDFVAEAARQEYGVDSQVIYPPVDVEVTPLPWEQKEDAFICSGRLTDAKAPHRVIKILKAVRDRGFPVKLYLTGGGGGLYGWKYLRFLKQMVAQNRDWVSLYQNLSYRDYLTLMSRCRYGIHFKREPFGISVAEMLKSDAIPFVRFKGGQLEIVGKHNQDLIFYDEAEAIEKIVSVLSDPARQQQLRASLNQQKSLFTREKFIADIQAVVAHYFADRAQLKLEPGLRSPIDP